MPPTEHRTRRVTYIGPNATSESTLDEFGSQQVSNLLPPYARLAAAGKIYVADMSGGTAKAPVTAMPTTSPEWGLYNASETDTLIPLSVSVNLVSGTAGLGLSIAVATALGAQTAVSSNYSGAIISCTDGSNDSSEAYIDNNPTLIGGTPAWFAVEGTKVNTVATDSVGDTITANLDGKWIAKPNGRMVAFEVVGETGTTALFDIQIVFAMVQLDTY